VRGQLQLAVCRSIAGTKIGRAKGPGHSGDAVVLPIITTYPADTELLPERIPKEWILDGLPQASAAGIARTADNGMWLAVWACTPGKFRWHYDVDETVHILSGEVFIVDDVGIKQRLGSGDTAYFPAGTSIIWHVTEEVRKIAVCRTPVPKLVVLASRRWRQIVNAFRRRHWTTGSLGIFRIQRDNAA
jgi:uncharacterized cupin superfamily protein